jgi:hypothetical protein
MFVAIGEVLTNDLLSKSFPESVTVTCRLSVDVDTPPCVQRTRGVTQQHEDLHQKAARRETALSLGRFASTEE